MYLSGQPIKTHIMKTVANVLFSKNQNEISHALKSALYNRLGDSSLLSSGIYFSTAEAMGEWENDCLGSFNEVSNAKYTGWEVRVSGNYDSYVRVVKPYIPNWVLKVEVKDYRHAKNLFNKYLKYAKSEEV